MFWLLAVLAMLGQLADVFTTQIALKHGLHEGNPIMALIVHKPIVMYMVKGGFVLASMYFANKWNRSHMVWFLGWPAGLGFFAAIWNMTLVLMKGR